MRFDLSWYTIKCVKMSPTSLSMDSCRGQVMRYNYMV